MALLRDRGVDADVIDDVARAETAIERYAPDIVVFDFPQSGAREVLQSIRRRWRDLPVIVSSAERPDVSDLLKDTRIAFLAKPFDGDSIISTMQGMLASG